MIRPIDFMVSLYGSVYEENNFLRREELRNCFLKNKSNKNIDHIHSIDERAVGANRPTYQDFFNLINKNTGEDDINILANSDIFFDEENIIKIKESIQPHQCFALTRYDIDEHDNAIFLNRRDSQDTWIFKGRVKKVNYADFFMGRPGCDNRIAHELKVVGYDVINPSMTIKSYHLHNSQIKSYDRNHLFVVPKPYLRLEPTEL